MKHVLQNRRLWETAALAALLAVALGTRLYELDRRSLWLDETYSVWNARGAFPGRFTHRVEPFTRADWRPSPRLGDCLASVRDSENTPPLYFLLLHGWMAVFGPTEIAIRGLSALIAALTAVLLVLLGKPIVGSGVATSAGWLLALSPLHVYYAREARNYTLAALLAVPALFALLEALHAAEGEPRSSSPAWRPWIAYALWCAAGLYSHYLFGIFVIALGGAVAILARGRRDYGQILGRLLACTAASAALLLPWLAYVWSHTRPPVPYSGGEWLAPTLRFGGKLLFYLFVGEASLKQVFLGLWFLSLPLAALLLWAGAGLQRGQRDRVRFAGRLAGLSVPLFLLGLAAACALQRSWLIVSPRYAVMVLPPLCLAIAAGLYLAAGRRAPRAAAGMVALYAALLLSPVSALGERPGEDWRGAAARVAADARPGDVILFDGALGAVPFNHYYGGPLPQVALSGADPARAAARAAAARRRISEAARVWVVRCAYDPATPEVRASVLAGLVPEPAATMDANPRVERWRRAEDPPAESGPPAVPARRRAMIK
ncbi:MAG: glycosyltransferase family 39 protein [Armatimonadetes bacterium]|nr:glycosyltransferase family 39 protein [Armatimonadota bacterium]